MTPDPEFEIFRTQRSRHRAGIWLVAAAPAALAVGFILHANAGQRAANDAYPGVVPWYGAHPVATGVVVFTFLMAVILPFALGGATGGSCNCEDLASESSGGKAKALRNRPIPWRFARVDPCETALPHTDPSGRREAAAAR